MSAFLIGLSFRVSKFLLSAVSETLNSGTVLALRIYYILKTRKQGSGRLNDWCKIAQLVGVRDDI